MHRAFPLTNMYETGRSEGEEQYGNGA